MKNNKLLLTVMLMIAMLPISVLAGSIDVSLSNYDPLPALPGQTVKVWLLVQNTGDDDLKNIQIEVTPEFPFSLYGGSAVKTIPILGSQSEYLVDFTLKVADGAVQGTNTLKITYKSDTQNPVEDQIPLSIQSRDATLSIEKVVVDPEPVAPGQDGKVIMTVKNNAPTSITDISIKLDLDPVTTGSLTTDRPFAPVDSTAEKRIYQIEPGQEADFVFNLRVYPDATSKIYKIPFTMTYYNSLGEETEKEDYIGFIVNSKPDITVTLDKTDLSQKKRTGSITLQVVNKGLNDVKFMNIVLKESDVFELLSTSDTTYVGNLESDDFQTLEYKIAIKDKSNRITLPVQIEYMDSNNQEYTTLQQIDLKLLEDSQLNEANGGGSSMITGIVLIIIIGGAVWWYVRSKNRKKKPSA